MKDFSYLTALIIFFTYVIIDMLYAAYIIAVNNRHALSASLCTATIYSLLAFGVVSYSANIYYLIPLASGAFVGTFVVVRFKKTLK